MATTSALPPVKPPDWHATSAEAALRALESDAIRGLTCTEASTRLTHFGPNCLPLPPKRGPWLRFAMQFHNPLLYVLLASGLVTLLLRDYVDAVVIFGVVVINAVISFVQEGKAEKALDAVLGMLASRATVVRDGTRREIDAALLVPGDIVFVESGAKVPADLRLLQIKNLQISEAALTGESLPVCKVTTPSAAAVPIADRTCMAYSSTVVNVGQAVGLVIGTGANSEIGRLGALVGEIRTLTTPLTRRLDQFARQVTLATLAVGLVTFLFGYFWHAMPLMVVFLAVVGLAVAAIPEGLPAVVTIVLALGTRVMAKKRAIIRRLPAVETLGSVTVICSDKTGTLTRNEMTAVSVMLPSDTLDVTGSGYAPDGTLQRDGVRIDFSAYAALNALAQCALLCNDAQLTRDESSTWQLVGDPTEGALLTLASKAGLDPIVTTTAAPRIDTLPFESENQFMATLHRHREGGVFVLLKGAPERLLDLCVNDASGLLLDREVWHARVIAAAQGGQRVLALARCEMQSDTASLTMADITRRFTLLGLVGLIDPPRLEAIAAVKECQQAGIRVKMITGDHAVTALAIGRRLGLNGDSALTGDMITKLDNVALREQVHTTDIFARASPEHKLRLVAALQARGELVAMTGDGVNDAPALKAADIGIAMGHKGTDAAREAADLVLADDNFATIASAVREGRVVFDNIKKSLLFILPTNVGEAGIIILAIFLGAELPVTAGQILWINMVASVTLALALAFESAEPGVMQRPPRPRLEPFISAKFVARIAYVSVIMIAVTFGVFEWELARGNAIEVARTAAVNMLVLGQVFYLFNVRHFTQSAFSLETLTGNPTALRMSFILVALQLLFTYWPPLQRLFLSAPLDVMSWMIIVALAAAQFLAVEMEKAVLRRLVESNGKH